MTLPSQPVPQADSRYPVGRFQAPSETTRDALLHAIASIAELPTELRNVVEDLAPDQLDTPYREGGWTVRQVIHHVADSHLNAYARIRLALTEDWPRVKPYDEGAWAVLHDAVTAPIEWSLELIESLHARWVMLLQSLDGEGWQRGYDHPEEGRVTVERAVLKYAWHGRHHTAHIAHLRSRMDW